MHVLKSSRQVRVADWSNFSQYVKQHYLPGTEAQCLSTVLRKHGIHCSSWKESQHKALDPTPPSRAPRAFPKWIAELLSDRPLLNRPLPYERSLMLSGIEVRPAAAEAFEEKPQNSRNSEAAVESGEQKVKHEVKRHLESLQQPIPDWLESIDDSGFLVQYLERIISNFDSLQQIHDIYFHEGSLDPEFFAVAGIVKLGHKRIVEKWFRERC